MEFVEFNFDLLIVETMSALRLVALCKLSSNVKPENLLDICMCLNHLQSVNEVLLYILANPNTLGTLSWLSIRVSEMRIMRS